MLLPLVCGTSRNRKQPITFSISATCNQ